jgi:hypothetical protein
MIESGMDFIEDNIFKMEKYTQIKLKKCSNIKTVEFIRIIKKKYIFVEAKMRLPKQEDEKDFDEKMAQIAEKFIHSLCVFSSIKLNINENDVENYRMPKDFNAKKILFLLVICDPEEKTLFEGYAKKIKYALLTEIRKISIIPNSSEVKSYILEIFRPDIVVMDKTTAENKNIIKKTPILI